MGISTRVLLAVLLGASLIGTTARHTPPSAAALALRGTVFVGTVTCTLDNSFHHSTTNHAGQTEERTLEEHARTTFVLARGKPILGTGTYSYRLTSKSTDPAQDIQDRSEETLQGSFSGPIQQPNDFNGFELNRPTELLVYTLQISVTVSYAQSHESRGHVLARNDPPRPRGSISYPDRDTPLPVLTVSEGRPSLSGGVSRNVIDSETKKVDGHDGCTWSLLVVLFNGQLIAGSGPSTASDPTRTSTPTPSQSCPLEVGPGAGPSGVPPESYAEELGGPARAASRNQKIPEGPSILWEEPDQLTWLDYRKVAPNPRPTLPDDPTSVALAVTRSGLGTVVDHGPYREVCDPKTHISTTKVTFAIGNEHALFYPEGSWVLPEYRSDPSTAEATGILNHEQRHFDISEVYSRKAHAALLSLLGGTFVHTFTCRQWADCTTQVDAFYQRLRDTKDVIRSQWKAAQKRYDGAAGRITQTAGQAEWNLIIKGWLDDFSTAPLSSGRPPRAEGGRYARVTGTGSSQETR